MLEFYYDCVDKFCNREDFQLMAMDTYSLYMALSADCLTDIIKPDMQSLFEKEKHQWFPRSQLPASAAFDRREPGLFIEEFLGTAMVALCCKTYCVENNEHVRTSKFSCKCLNKSNFSHPLTLYKEVSFNQSSADETNCGFRTRDNTIFYLCTASTGLNFLLPKA